LDYERKFGILVIILAAVIAIGTLGYIFIERWSPLDALYMTVITLTTVGFGEVHPLSHSGKIFTIVLVVMGVAGVAYTLSVIARMVVEGEIKRLLGRRKMQKGLKELTDHYIVCGFGRVGRRIAQELYARGVPFVVVDRDPQRIEQAEMDCFIFVQGDSTNDQTLLDAGVKRAKGLITAVVDEADSVFIVLSARQLNPKLFITARAESDQGEKKLFRAGANRVISPHKIGGIRMALTALRPNLVDFMSLVSFDQRTDLSIEEIEVKPGSSLVNSTIKDCHIRHDLGVSIVGVKKTGKDVFLNPSPETTIDGGDILIVVGDRKGLERLEELTSGF
jgi:voltage-gated potassium channel